MMLIRALVLVLTGALWTSVGMAQPPLADVRVLIDVSGSMRQNDPDNLRGPALALLARLIPAGSHGGVWTFGTDTRNLVAPALVDARWRQQALEIAEAIDSTELYTDIPGALREASQPGIGGGDRRRSIILLTDGMVDLPGPDGRNAAARRELLEELLPELRKAGFTLHTVALSNNADRELLERLAIDSGGTFAAAAAPEELERIFLAALDAAAPAEQLPLQGRCFLVDSSINEFTALVYRDSGVADTSLTGPDGRIHTAADPAADTRWLATANYDLITVSNPSAGEWRLATTPHPGSRITIVSDLNLVVMPLPSSFFAGADPVLGASLFSEGKLLDNQDLLQLIDVRVDILRRQDERSWRLAVPGSGRDASYQTELTMLAEPGGYELQVIADGKTFRRQYQRRVEVMAPFRISLQPSEPNAGAEFPAHTLELFQLDPDWMEKTVQATVRIRAPTGGASQPVAAVGERRWRTRFDSWEQAGSYSLYVELRGEDATGATRQWRSPTMGIEQHPSQPAATTPGTSIIEPVSQPAAVNPAAPPVAAEPENETGVWIWASALTGANLALVALLWFGWTKLRRSGIAPAPDDAPERGPADNADDSGGSGSGGDGSGGDAGPGGEPAAPDRPSQGPDADGDLSDDLQRVEDELSAMEVIGEDADLPARQ